MRTRRLVILTLTSLFFLIIASSTILSAPDSDPTGLSGLALGTTELRWSWNDNSTDEDGFELQDASNNIISTIAASTDTGVLSYDESGLLENNQYTRHIVSYTATTTGETADQDTAIGSSYSNNPYNYNNYRLAQTFTPAYSGYLTKVEFYAYAYSSSSVPLNLYIYPVDTSDLPDMTVSAYANSSVSLGTSAAWYTAVFSEGERAFLTSGIKYAIVFHSDTTSYSYTNYLRCNASDTYAGGNMYDSSNSGDAWDFYYSSSSLYELRIKTYMIPEIRDYSAATSDVSAYTAVHDPTTGEFTLVDNGQGEVLIDVTPPQNATSGVTGVNIQRIEDGQNWASDAVDIVTGFPANYQVTDDTIGANGTYWYRIKFCNGDSVETAWSTGNSVDMETYPPIAPDGFYGQVVSENSIRWFWTDNSTDESGFVVQDTSDNTYVTTEADAASGLETSLDENTEYTRQSRAFVKPTNPEIEAATYNAPDYSSSSAYYRGIRFRPLGKMKITKVSRYAGSQICLFTDSGITPLYSHNFATTTQGLWVEEELASPWELSNDTYYKIVTYNNASSFTYYYDLLTQVTESGDIEITHGCYGSSYPSSTNSSYAYGLVNFKYIADEYGAAYYDGSYTTSSSAYSRGFQFTTSQDLWVTKLSRYRGTIVTIHDDSTQAIVLEHTFTSPVDGTWVEEELTTAFRLPAGTYRISTWNNGSTYSYSYDTFSYVTGGSLITINYGCYGSGQWPTTTTSSYVYGLVSFSYVTKPTVYSTASNTDSIYTLIHDPVDADLTLYDKGSANVEIEVTPPNNPSLGSTSVYIERDEDGSDWSNAVQITNWSSTYTHADNVPSNGTWYYRIKFRNAVGTETATYIEFIDIVSYPPEDPDNLHVDSGHVTSTSITWTWDDNSDDEEGFEVQDETDTHVGDSSENGTTYLEDGLQENTQYTRHIYAYNVIYGSETNDQSNETGSTNNYYNYYYYRQAQTFTPAYSGHLTEVEFFGYANSASSVPLDVYIYPVDTSELPDTTVSAYAHTSVSLSQSPAAWYTAAFSEGNRAYLTAGVKYAIVYHSDTTSSTYANRLYYYGSNVYADGDMCDSTDYGATWDFYYSVSTRYEMQFRTKMIPAVKNYSTNPTVDLSKYTAVHEPLDTDFSVTSGTFGLAIIDVTPPNNSTLLQTGVQIWRADNPAMTDAVMVRDFSNDYTYEDTVPSGGVWYYAIVFRNAEGLETGMSLPNSEDIPGPLEQPTLTGQGVATDTVEWSWNDVTGATKYILRDENGKYVIHFDPASSPYQETVSGENEPATKQIVSALTTVTQLSVEPPVVIGSTIPWYVSGARVQLLYSASELSDTECLVKGMYWCRNLMGDNNADYNGVTIKLGHTNLDALGGTFASNYTENDETLVWTADPYTVGPTTLNQQWYGITYDDEFYYDGVNNLLIDIDVTSGTSTLGWLRGDGTSTLLYGFPSGSTGTILGRKLYLRLEVDKISTTSIFPENIVAYSLIHDPIDTDITLADLGALQVSVTIAPPSNPTLGQTGVYIEHDLQGDWTGADYGVVTGDWTQTYSHTDTVSSEGTWYYRIKFRNGQGQETATFTTSVGVTSTPVPPVADFEADDTDVYVGELVTFTDLSTGTIDTWEWDFDNNASVDSTAQNPTHSYGSAGTYTVSLVVSGIAGSATEIKTSYITVTDIPPTAIPDFYSDTLTGEAPLTVNFYDCSTGSVDSWSWDFGDTVGTSTETDPTYIYNTPGTYTVSLTVDGTYGGGTETKTGYIVVISPVVPTPYFSATPLSGEAPLTVSFTDLSTGIIDSWEWDFGDGVGTSTSLNPTYEYTTANTYTVTLVVTRSGVGSATEIKTNYIDVVEPGVPIADFTATPLSGTVPLTVSFTDCSTGTIDSWSWDFGDGVGTSTEPNPTYEYTSVNTYTVSLTVTRDIAGSNTETKTDYIVVNNVPAPEVDFEATPLSGTAPLTVTFTDLTSGQATSYSWDFGDGVGTSDQIDPSYEYTTPGIYTVSFTVTGPGGIDTETKTDYIEVFDPSLLMAEFSASTTIGTPPLEVTFTDMSTGNYSTLAWDFDNDGEIDSTDPNPTHTYNQAGTYSVKLTIDGPDGPASETKIAYITVNDPGFVTVEFSASPTTGDAPLEVSFTDLSTGAITSWSWDFGDGGTSTEPNPTYTYNTAGVYTVSLTISGPSDGGNITKTDYITVTGAATPAPPAKDSSSGCSCSVDRKPVPANNMLGYFIPAILLACAYACLRRRR